MSGKETIQSWLDEMSNDLSVPEILKALQDRLAEENGAGPDDDYEWPTPDVTEEDWRLFVAQGLRDELADTREDIYTEEDGEPANGQG